MHFLKSSSSPPRRSSISPTYEKKNILVEFCYNKYTYAFISLQMISNSLFYANLWIILFYAGILMNRFFEIFAGCNIE